MDDLETSRRLADDILIMTLVEILEEARLQIEYLDGKLGGTGTGAATLARIDAATRAVRSTGLA